MSAWLMQLYLSTERSDVTIRVPHGREPDDPDDCWAGCSAGNDSLFPVHSFVLRCQSPVFDAMLSQESFLEGKTKVINLQGYSPRAVEYFLRYLYTGRLEDLILSEHTLELLRVSHQYDTKGLFAECCRRLSKSVTLCTSCELYQAATYVEAHELLSVCGKMIKENISDVLENDLFFGFDDDVLFSFPCKEPRIRFRHAYKRIANYNSCIKGSIRKEFPSGFNFDIPETDLSPYGDEKFLTRSITNDLFMNSKLSDVEIVVLDVHQEARFFAHSLILNFQSERFMEIWIELKSLKISTGEREQITITGISPRIVEYLLSYLYRHRLPSEISDSNLMDLVRLADEYKVSSLLRECEGLLLRRLTRENLCQVISLASRHDLARLKFRCYMKIPIFGAKEILENRLHFCLNLEDMTLFMDLAKWEPLENTEKQKIFLWDWARWRLCLRGVEPILKAIDELVEHGLSRVFLLNKKRLRRESIMPTSFCYRE